MPLTKEQAHALRDGARVIVTDTDPTGVSAHWRNKLAPIGTRLRVHAADGRSCLSATGAVVYCYPPGEDIRGMLAMPRRLLDLWDEPEEGS